MGGRAFCAADGAASTAGAVNTGMCEGRCFPTFLLLGERANTALRPLRLARSLWLNSATELELKLVRSGMVEGSGADLGLRLCDMHTSVLGEHVAALCGSTILLFGVVGFCTQLVDGDPHKDGATFAT